MNNKTKNVPGDVTEAPEQTRLGEVTEVPEQTGPGVVTEAPEQTGPGVVTEAPEQTGPGEVTETPEQTGPGEVTEAPEQTGPGEVTEAPEQTGPGVVTEAPARAARVWQIDALRGAAIVLMTIFHALVDIRDFFGFADIRYFDPPYSYIGRASAILFIFISGISCRFSKNNIKRGLVVLLCGMAVTLATFIAVRDLYIRFGILHFLGSAMIITGALELLFNSERNRALLQRLTYVAAPLSLLLGRIFSQMRTGLPFLFVVGITTDAFASYDFYPLFPWIGVYFAGYAVGLTVYKNRVKLAAMNPGRIAARLFAPLCALGRVSLIYYLLHQPALLAVFFAVEMFRRIAFNL